MFHYDNGLMLTRSRLAVDFSRRQPRGFISHAHADHMARHELAICTPETGQLYQHRLGKHLRFKPLPYREPLDFGDLQLTTYPAGHCLGSAMLLADDGKERLLYTGDYKLGDSLTAAAAELPQADLLVMECTFGQPRYRMPPRAEVVQQLLDHVHHAMQQGRTPVVHAYAFGKAQEVTKILTTAGVPVLQHPQIWALSQVYEACGMPLASEQADYACYAGAPLQGHAVVTLPKSMKGYRLAGLGSLTSLMVTGWAIDPGTAQRRGVDIALPLSDHADFDELVETVRRVDPKEVYCTHGPRVEQFAEHLCSLGFSAQPLAQDRQKKLF